MFSAKLLTSYSKILFRLPKKIFISSFDGYKPLKYCKIRSLFTTIKCDYIIHKQTDNDFGHKVMEENFEKFSLVKFINPPTSSISNIELENMLLEDWTGRKPDEVISGFEKISQFALCNNMNIDLEKLDSFIDVLADNIPKMNDDQLELVFQSLKKWPETESIATRNFIEVWGSLDDALFSKLPNFNVDKILLFSDHMYDLRLVRKSDYVTKAVYKLNQKVMSMTPQQLVQSMFIIGCRRRAPKFVVEFEIKLSKIFSEFSIDELGIISLGFFKSKTPLRSAELVEEIIHKVTKEANSVHEMTLCSLLKIIRYSSSLRNLHSTCKMLDVLSPRIPELSLFCCLQIALVGTKNNIFHRESLNNISIKFVNDPSAARFKDIERLTFVLSEYNYHPQTTPPIFDTIVNELRKPERSHEMQKHGRSFLRTLSFLTTMNIYPKDLIHKALTKDFLNDTYGKKLKYVVRTEKLEESIREIIVMKYSADIEMNDYNGDDVDKDLCRNIVNMCTDYIPEPGGKYKLNNMEQMIVDITLVLRKMRNGSAYVECNHLLPHFQVPDIVICNDISNKPLEVSKYFPSKNWGSIQYAPDKVNKWFAILCVGKYHIISNTRFLLGPAVMKIRQLKKIGYRPIVITRQGWDNLKTENEKITYMNNIINGYDEDEDYMRIAMNR